jgi:catechol 2,3-dioxygenase-like lactoylglutathione lyase family enzyme
MRSKVMRIVGTHHVALTTANFVRMKQFYVETLGLPQVGAFASRNIIFIDAGSTTIELIGREAPAESVGAWAHFAFEVEDIEATYAELTALGISFDVLPKPFPDDGPEVKLAFFKDPDGNDLELVQPLAQQYPQRGM